MKKTRIVNSMFTPDLSTYTYPGILTDELLQKPKIVTPAISDFATVMPGIRSGQHLNLVQPLTRVLEKGTANCIPTYTQSGAITDRKIDTGLFEINKSWCKKEFQGLLSNPNVLGDSKLIGDGLRGYDLTGRLLNVVLDEITEQSRIDVWKVYMFGNNSFSSSSNMYTTIDGLWTKYLDSFASYCVKPVTNSLPNGATSVLNANQARDTFKLMYAQSGILLKQLARQGKAKIFATGSMWENYEDSLIDNCCVEGSWKLGQDGAKTLYYKGIEIVPMYVWDLALELDTDNPYYNLLRHFAIMTIPENQIFGTENMADLNNIEACYTCKDKTLYLQGEMRFGAQFIQCDLTTIAY